MSERRRIGELLSLGALTGGIAALAAGAIDAVWSWAPAAQFVPGVAGRARFVVYTALSHAATGLLVGVCAAAAIAVVRATRLGDVVRFAWREHVARRANDPRDTVAGLALALVAVPVLAAALAIAYRIVVPYVANRHVVGLVVIVAMAAAVVALGVAAVATFVIARPLERALRPAAGRWRPVSSPWAPLVAIAAEVALGAAVWAWRAWDTAKLLPLRGPLIAAVALVLAVPAFGPASRAVVSLGSFRPAVRRGAIAGGAVLAFILVLAAGGSAAVIKAEVAYTGLGGPIARGIRAAFDWDRDGYSRFLGGGDCDDGDRSIHPGAPEIPDDGIDQNCVGGDAHAQREDTAFAPVPASVPKDFDVLLITIDTTRADHLSTYGYQRPTSPNIDKLAADGTVFEDGWAHAPSTRYSMPAILTGRLPLDVYYDMSVWWPGLLPKATTIAEALAPLGFYTGAITSYEYFDPKRHMNQGFVEYDNEDARLHTSVSGAGPEQTHGSSSKEQTDKAIAFVERHAGQRWFLWVHYYDPHYAYEPHAEVPSFGTDPEALYDGEIRFTDLHLGRLFDELRARGLYDKTVVVITGDHGEGFHEHGIDFHGYHLYSPQTKVPLIIRVPGLPPRRSTTPAGHVDILPTLVNLAGGQPTGDMMGRSLVDVLAGAPDRNRTVFQQLSYEGNHEMRAGVDRTCHVIYNVSPETSWEVYRVDRDPLEAHDLAGDDDACAETREAVARWYDAEAVPPGAAEALLKTRPAIAHALDVQLGSSVKLLSVDAPARARPGESVTLVWTFEATGRIASGWKLFVHVAGPTFVNADHSPVRPFEWWRPGDFIRYSTQVTLPYAPGRYTVKVGMFRGTQRAHVTGPHVANDEADVATIEVAP